MQHPEGEVTSVDVPPSVVEKAEVAEVVEDAASDPTLLGLDIYAWVGIAVVVAAIVLWRLGVFGRFKRGE